MPRINAEVSEDLVNSALTLHQQYTREVKSRRKHKNKHHHVKKADAMSNKYLEKIANKKGVETSTAVKTGLKATGRGLAEGIGGAVVGDLLTTAAKGKGHLLGQIGLMAGLAHGSTKSLKNSLEREKRSSVWGSVLKAGKNFAKGVVEDAPKIGDQLHNIGVAAKANKSAFVPGTISTVKALAGNKAMQAGAGLAAGGFVAGRAMSPGQQKQSSLSENIYLKKIAEVSTQYVYHDITNEHSDPYTEGRLYDIDEANQVLLDKGYKPGLNDNPADVASARYILDSDFKSGLRPNEVVANRLSGVAGLGTGIGAAIVANKYLHNPIISGVAGAGAAILAAKGLHHVLYGSDSQQQKRVEDDAAVAGNTNRFLQYLDHSFTKLPPLPQVS